MKYYNYPDGTKTAEALDSENTAVVKGPDGKYIAPNELPAITAQDAGKVVKVNAAGTGLEYGEAGGAGVSVMRIGSDAQTNALDKTWQEISDCFANGGYAYVAIGYAPDVTIFTPVVVVSHIDTTYSVVALAATEQIQNIQFACSSPDEYPVVVNGEDNN